MSMKKVIGYDLDDILRLANLRRGDSAVEQVAPALGFIALGAAIGVGVGLMLAPSSGRRLRQDLTERVGHFRDRMSNDRASKREYNSEMENPSVPG
jgi:hypothetical protein